MSVYVLRGNGGGTLGPRTAFPTGKDPLSVAIADFDHDGRLDVVTASLHAYVSIQASLRGTVAVLRGNGDGTLQNPVLYDVGQGCRYVMAADLDGDGNVDLAATSFNEQVLGVLRATAMGPSSPWRRSS